MPVVRTEYQTGETLEALLQQDLGGTLTFPLELLGAGVIPTSGSVVLTDGTTTVASGAATAANPPTFAVNASQCQAVDRGLIYEARWTFVFGSGPTAVTRTYRQRVGIVRWAPDCPVSTTSLTKGRPVLTRFLQGTNQNSFDPWIQRAWEELQRWLKRKGNRAHLVADMSDLYSLADAWTRALFLEDLALNAEMGSPLHCALSDVRQELRDLQRDTVFEYDPDDSDSVVTDQRAAAGSFHLSSGGGLQGALT